MWTIRMPMYKALLDKVSRGRNLPPKWAAFFIAGEKPGEMEAICSSFLPLLILCRPLLWLWALAWACGALSICWRATARTILVPKARAWSKWVVYCGGNFPVMGGHENCPKNHMLWTDTDIPDKSIVDLNRHYFVTVLVYLFMDNDFLNQGIQ